MESSTFMIVPTTPELILHLGCGRKGRDVPIANINPDQVRSLDADPLLKPDMVCQLGTEPIPLEDNSVDLAVAYHVLEHIGRQGETEEWFFFWEDLYRVLVPRGKLVFESPLYNSVWAWADPQHTRALSPQSFIYLEQASYRMPESAITPYRIKCDFQLEGFTGVADGNPEIARVEGISHFHGTLSALKPLKPWWLNG